jgi:phosphoribosylformylglycinamidine (FGAM) synthase-like amidotransferase family enzyme
MSAFLTAKRVAKRVASTWHPFAVRLLLMNDTHHTYPTRFRNKTTQPLSPQQRNIAGNLIQQIASVINSRDYVRPIPVPNLVLMPHPNRLRRASVVTRCNKL